MVQPMSSPFTILPATPCLSASPRFLIKPQLLTRFSALS
jgi:hypothetical protein